MRQGLRALRFDVKLLPCGLRATVIAPDVICAAQSLRVLLPANEALVYGLDRAPAPGAHIPASTRNNPLRVTFDDRECCVHFIGFKGEEYHSAVRLWGVPDVYHRRWDQRARREIGPGDLLVFARWSQDEEPSPYNFDDSNEPDDPGAKERLGSMAERRNLTPQTTASDA